MSGITSGLIAAAATGGALVGVGHRYGTAARPFNAVAALVLGASAQESWGFSPSITLVGVAVHTALSLLWGVLFGALAMRPDRRGRAHRVRWALVVALAHLVLSWLLARALGVGLDALLALGDRLLVAIVLAVALPSGMRFAFPTPREGERSRDSV